ncbi:MAG TPA: hypothetical protein DEB06_05580 [Phycisphaerales bacterium]|nr:hypothetical protein [Phycisphaerales bacterium]
MRRVLAIATMICGCAGLSVAQSIKPAEESKPAAARATPPTPRDPFIPASLADAVQVKDVGEELPEAPTGRAPPANDACASPEQIAGVGTFPFDNTEATTDGLAHFGCNFFGQSQITRDVWFLWTAPSAGNYRIETCGLTTLDTKMALYSTGPTCPPGDVRLLQCNDDACGSQSRLQFDATMGQQFLLRLGVFPNRVGGAGSFRVALTPGQDVCQQPTTNCQAQDFATAYDGTSMFPFDDFRPAQSGQVTRICWFGAYFNGVGNCQGAEQDDFIVEYYPALGGGPDSFPIASFVQSFNDLQVTGPVPTGQLIAGAFPVFAYSATHAPVNVSANTCYWVSIRNELSGECVWFWQAGAGGNGVIFHANGAFPGISDVVNDDLAFCVNLPLSATAPCASAAPPAADECAGAPLLGSNSVNFIRNVFATENVGDPDFSCKGGGAGPGLGTLWYRFTPPATTARLTLCQNTTGDTLLAVYTGTCGNLTEIACNDDFCGRRSQINLTGLTPGQTYYIQFASFDEISLDRYRLDIASPTPPPPPNDVCLGAIELDPPPGGTDGDIRSIADAFPDADAPTCAFSPTVSPTIWYSVTGNGEKMTASLCSTSVPFDTKMNVYCGSCDDLVCIAQNDDDCFPQARVEWCSEPGRVYYIMVHGFNGSVGEAFILAFSDGEPCSPPPACPSCEVACPPGAVAENEACGESMNNGCNDPSLRFQALACGQTVCGTAPAIANVRDTDWYEFTLSVPSLVTWSIETEVPVEILLLDGVCFPAPTVLAQAVVERCGSGSVSARLAPGVYRAFVGSASDGYPCGPSSVYRATLDCEPLGACCSGSDCSIVTGPECALQGGVFAGGGSECPTVYAPAPCMSVLEDIQITGTDLDLGNDDAVAVDLGFVFKFFGEPVTSVVVSSEGFINFGAVAPQTPNAPIPTATAPNALVAPLWDDFSPAIAGSVRVETKGSAPQRRFIVQWTDVPRFLQADSNTFQCVLFEETGCIEFRYGAFTPQPATGDYTVGVENFSGTAGTAVDAATLAPGACVRLCPSSDPMNCVPPPSGCAGDADANGRVDFDDITTILASWLTAGPQGDANNDGVVDFDDITAVLADWLCVSSSCEGDANSDGFVDFDDITTVLANWNTNSPMGDANHDGTVDFDDITAILSRWNTACPAP